MLVRTTSDGDLEILRAAGATEVVPEIVEGSLMLASHALALTGVPLPRVLRADPPYPRRPLPDAARLLSRAPDDQEAENIEETHQRLQTVTIQAGGRGGGPGAGRPAARGVPPHRLVRAGRRIVDPAPDLGIEAGDTLVLAGHLRPGQPAPRQTSRRR